MHFSLLVLCRNIKAVARDWLQLFWTRCSYGTSHSHSSGFRPAQMQSSKQATGRAKHLEIKRAITQKYDVSTLLVWVWLAETLLAPQQVAETRANLCFWQLHQNYGQSSFSLQLQRCGLEGQLAMLTTWCNILLNPIDNQTWKLDITLLYFYVTVLSFFKLQYSLM
jgi:hypothetical protein